MRKYWWICGHECLKMSPWFDCFDKVKEIGPLFLFSRQLLGLLDDRRIAQVIGSFSMTFWYCSLWRELAFIYTWFLGLGSGTLNHCYQSSPKLNELREHKIWWEKQLQNSKILFYFKKKMKYIMKCIMRVYAHPPPPAPPTAP